MERYALLLRGVNVGRGNSLPMAELRALLEALGATEVATYIQSGNAVLATTRGPDELSAAVEAALERRMGRRVATTLRMRAQLAAIVAANPFADIATTPKFLCVTFLSAPPGASALAGIEAAEFGDERWELSGREIYSWHPHGQGLSPLAEAIAKLPLSGTATTRNWNTVLKLLAMLGDG